MQNWISRRKLPATENQHTKWTNNVCANCVESSALGLTLCRSSAASPGFPSRTKSPLLRSGRELNPAGIADKLRSVSSFLLRNIAVFTEQREWFCPVLTLPSVDLQNPPDLIPAYLCTYHFSYFLLEFLGLFPQEIPLSCQTPWAPLTDGSVMLLLYFSLLGNSFFPL